MPSINPARRSLPLILASLPAWSGAATLQVPADHQTIQAAVNAAVSGDIVLVDPGTYPERIDIVGKSIVLRSSAGPATTIIDAQNLGQAVRLAAGAGGEIALEGFTVQRGSGTFGGGVAVSGRAVVRDNHFRDNAQGSGGSGAAIDCNGCTALVERNVFSGNSCDSQFLSGVVTVLNGADITLRSNLFVDNPCRAINITAPSSARAVVLGNTFVGNATGVYIDARTGTNTGQIVRHNLIAGNGIGLEVAFAFGPLTAVVADNVLFANTMQVSGAASPIGSLGNRDVDPVFVAAGAGDYRLRADSSLIDTPSTAVTEPLDWGDSDLAGRCRRADADGDGLARIDVGAYEFADVRIFREGFEAEAEPACTGVVEL